MAEKRPSMRTVTGGRKDPLVVRVLEAENPEFRDAIRRLTANGSSISLQAVRHAPAPLIEAFDRVKNNVSQGKGDEGDVPLVTAKALAHEGTLARGSTDTEMQPDIRSVRDGVRNLTTLVATGGNVDTATLETANHILQTDPTVQRYAVHRLTWDIPEGEKNGLRKTILTAGGAALAGYGLEFIVARSTTGIVSQLAEGAGLFATGQADDAASAYGTFQTERGGGKRFGQILKENKSTLAMMGLAGAADFAFLPLAFKHKAFLGTPEVSVHTPLPFLHNISIPEHILHTPLDGITNMGWYWPTVAGLTFAFTAFAGSITGKVSNIKRSASTIRALDKEGLLPGRNGKANTLKPGESLWLGLMENQSHPFRLGLLAGIGLSLSASLIASFTGVLEGSQLSSTIQAAIGPLETGTAFIAAAGLAEAGYARYRTIAEETQLRRRLARATASH